MPEIEVSCVPAGDGWNCTVSIADDDSSTSHAVSVSTADLERLAPGATSPDDLVRRSFEFLLSREPKESILRAFALPAIGRYFPEYDETIRG